MKEVLFLNSLHTATKRDYFSRINNEKPECMRIAKLYDERYWDGDRKYGYGGMKYDGRYALLAKDIIKYYKIKNDNKILDIGCGKGFLLYEINKLQPVTEVWGIDISDYAIVNTKLDKTECHIGNCALLPWKDNIFTLSYSINVFHNLCYSDLKKSIREMVRVTSPMGNSYICVESYRNEEELCNLQMWALTCQSFYSPEDWKNILLDNGYDKDVEFIYFQ